MSNNIPTCTVGGKTATRNWGIPSIFGGRASSGDTQAMPPLGDTVPYAEQTPSTIQLREVIVCFTDVYF